MSRYSRIGVLVALIAGVLGLAGTAGAQEGAAVITGTVQGDQGRPLTGATVVVVELNAGAPVNEAGRYNIVIPAARVAGQTVTLRARFIGYQPQTRTITLAAGSQTQDFTLRLDPTRLSEVVVTGVTGETERAKVPFTVARVDTADMPVQAVNPLNQLQGKVPGANIASTSGRPGQAPQVILRGPTSINASGRGQEPLYIVDGVILGSSIADINPADIESVEVVKGAAASSLYGSRAGAGVIQIRTKRGRANASDGVSFSVRQEYGINDIERDFGIARQHPFLLDETGTRFCVFDPYGSNTVCSRTVDYEAERARVNNTPGDFALPPASFPVDPGAVTSGDILRRAFLVGQYPGRTYNAVAQLVDPKPISVTDATMSGRFGRTMFYTSGAFTQQAGAIMGLEGYQRVNGRINLEHQINDQWSFQANSYLSRAKQDGANQDEGGVGFFRLTRTPALVDITRRDAFGRRYIRTNLGSGGVQNENPLYSFEQVEREDIRYRYLAGATLKYQPLEWLDAEGNFSFDRLNLNFRQFQDKNFRTTGPNPAANNGLLFNGVNNTQAINGSAQVTARRQLLTDLNTRFNLRWLYEQQDFDGRSLTGNLLRVANVPAGANVTNILGINTGESSTRQMSYSAGAFFDYKDRYTMDLLVRRDGSSRFGRNERWQTYGRGSAAWLAAREPWFPFQNAITGLTFRASLGTAGNTPPFAAQYEVLALVPGGFTPTTQGNPDLKPEVIRELEVGTDIELFSRYALTVTHAFSRATNQILPTPVSVATGFPQGWFNAGVLDNRTWEASLTAPIVQTTNWNYTTRVNYTHNYAVVTSLNTQPFFIGTGLQATDQIMRIAVGERYGTFYGRKFVTSCAELPAPFRSDCGGSTSAFQKNDDGFIVWVGSGNNPGMGITHNLWNAVLPAAAAPWGVQAAWGMPLLVREDCAIPPCSPASRKLGHALPDYRVGWSHTVSWKGFSLYGLLDGAFGSSTWNQGRHWSYLDFLSRDIDQGGKSVATAKPIGYYYRAGPGPAGNNSGLGGFYDILGPNNRFVENSSYVKLREASIAYRLGRYGPGDWTLSLIGRNLKTWTRYTGFDPEVGISSSGESGSGLVNAIDAFSFPQLRSLSFVISAGF